MFVQNRLLSLFSCRYLLLMLVASLCWQGSATAEEEPRIWTDKSGKFQIRAKFVDVLKGKVRLERPNGTITQVPLGKLSIEDQKYIRALKKPKKGNRPRKGKSNVLKVGDRVEVSSFDEWEPATVVSIDLDFERVEVKRDSKPARFTRSYRLEDIRFPNSKERPKLSQQAVEAEERENSKFPDLRNADFSKVRRMLLEGSNASRAKADPLTEKIKGWKPRAVRLSDRSESFDRPLDFSICTSNRPFALVLTSQRDFDRDKSTLLELVDLKDQKVLATVNTHPAAEQVYLSPSGSSAVVILSDFKEGDTQDQIELWNISRKGLTRVLSFRPYAPNKWPDHEIKWCAWLDDELLLTTNTKGRTVLWEVKEANAKYELPTGHRDSLQLSPGRNQIAIPSSEGIHICNSRTGKLMAMVGSGNFQHCKFAFSPSGEKIAALSGNFLDVVDLPTGKTTYSFPCQGVGMFSDFWWIDEQFLFAGNSFVVDVPHRIVAWKYDIRSKITKPVGDTQWALFEDHSDNLRILMPFDLPPQEAIRAVADLDEQKLLVVKPGSSVSIEVQIEKNPILAKEVEATLRTSITEAGLTVAEDQPLRMVARITNGKTEEVTYHNFGSFNRSGEKISVTDNVYEIELLLNEVPIWEWRSTQSSPQHIRLEEGESNKDAIARIMKPSSERFHCRIPAYVVKPEYKDPLGNSKLSLDR